MPYALFSNDAKLSKAYPDRSRRLEAGPEDAAWWSTSVSEEEESAPRPVLDNDYEIRPCQPEPA